MNLPYWLLRLLPIWEYICPKCRKGVKQSAHQCPHCGEKFPLAVRVPPSFLKDPKKLEEYVHRYIFPRVSKFERDYLTKYFTVLFESGWENSGGTDVTDGGAWTGVSDANSRLSVVASPVYLGSYALKMNSALSGESPYVFKTISAIPTTYTRIYVRFESLPDSDGDWITLIAVGNAANWSPMTVRVQHDGVSAKWRVHNEYFGGIAWVAVSPVINTWYCIELRVTNGIGGPITLYIDGVEKASVTQSALYNQDSIHIVAPNTTGGYGISDFTATAEFDCVVIADTYIGPEEEVPKPKGTIAIHAKVAGII